MVWCFGHGIQDVPKLVYALKHSISTPYDFFHVFKVLTVEDFKNSHVLKAMVFKIQYMKKK